MSPICLALIQGGVGFAIGAGTNDLAIRWIFHTVFAKKKREIAQAVQRVVSSELMTPDKVARRLVSPQSSAALQKAVEGYLADVAMIYAMISFVAVLMMASMFVPSKPKAPVLDRGKDMDTAAEGESGGEQK